jgi:hypothetical protein
LERLGQKRVDSRTKLRVAALQEMRSMFMSMVTSNPFDGRDGIRVFLLRRGRVFLLLGRVLRRRRAVAFRNQREGQRDLLRREGIVQNNLAKREAVTRDIRRVDARM